MMKKFMKKLWEKKDSKKGFTLVELIVVLVILAILAAIMIPALLGWIDRAKEKQVVLEARSTYLAAQTLASEGYALPTPSKDGVSTGNVETLAGVAAGTVSGITYADTTGRDAYIVSGITYTSDGLVATYTTLGGWVVNPVTTP